MNSVYTGKALLEFAASMMQPNQIYLSIYIFVVFYVKRYLKLQKLYAFN